MNDVMKVIIIDSKNKSITFDMNNIVRSLSSLGQVTDSVCIDVCLYFGVSEPYLGTL